MSLFVGNLSKNVTYDQLRDVFEEYGPCKVEKKVSLHRSTAKVRFSFEFADLRKMLTIGSQT